MPIGSSRCRIAIEKWLPIAKSAAFKTTIDRSVRISAGELSTVKGEIETLDGESTGEMSAFCDSGSAVIAIGLGDGARASARHAQMSSLISSFRYLDPKPVRPVPTVAPVVQKPTPKRKPPRPRPTPSALPEPPVPPDAEEDEILPPR